MPLHLRYIACLRLHVLACNEDMDGACHATLTTYYTCLLHLLTTLTYAAAAAVVHLLTALTYPAEFD